MRPRIREELSHGRTVGEGQRLGERLMELSRDGDIGSTLRSVWCPVLPLVDEDPFRLLFRVWAGRSALARARSRLDVICVDVEER